MHIMEWLDCVNRDNMKAEVGEKDWTQDRGHCMKVVHKAQNRDSHHHS